MWSISLNVIKFEFLNYAAFGFHSLLNIMRDFECDRDACWTWLIFDVLNVNVWNVHVECDVWPWIWSRCLLNLINFHVLNAKCDRWMWSLTLNVIKFEFLNFAPFGLAYLSDAVIWYSFFWWSLRISVPLFQFFIGNFTRAPGVIFDAKCANKTQHLTISTIFRLAVHQPRLGL